MRKLSALICLFPEGHGGRDTSFEANYCRLGVVLPATGQVQYGAEINTQSNNGIRLGEIITSEISFFNETDALKLISPGEAFELFEGARRIGVGRWQ